MTKPKGGSETLPPSDKKEIEAMNIVGFDFKGSAVRTITIGKDAWYVAKDVCDILGYSKVESALRKLDDDEKGAQNLSTLGGNQEMRVINTSGLFSLILGSNKQEAKIFKKWVTSEVLPSIFTQGVYTPHKELQAKFAEEVKEYREKIGELEMQVYNLKEDLDEDAKADRKYMLERQKQIKASIQLFTKRYTKRGDRADFHELYSAYQNSCSAKGEPVGTELEFENTITMGSRFVFKTREGRFVGHIELDKEAMQRDFRHHYKEWAAPVIEAPKAKRKTKKDDGIPMDEWKGRW